MGNAKCHGNLVLMEFDRLRPLMGLNKYSIVNDKVEVIQDDSILGRSSQDL